MFTTLIQLLLNALFAQESYYSPPIAKGYSKELILEPIDYIKMYEQDPKQFSNVEIIPPDMTHSPFGMIKVELKNPFPADKNWMLHARISKDDHSKLSYV